MPTLTIKGMPDGLYRALKARAAEHRRSLNSEVLVSLERTVAPPPIDVEAVLARADAIRERLRLRGVPPLTEEFLRAAKDEGRP